MKHAKKLVYLIGSLANKNIPYLGNEIRGLGFDVFDDWWSPGPLADSYLGHYAKIRGLNYKQLLQTEAAKHIFNFDKSFLMKSDIAVMVMKAGKSAHLELGFIRGMGKPGYVLFDECPAKVDIMYGFASDVFFNKKELFVELKKFL